MTRWERWLLRWLCRRVIGRDAAATRLTDFYRTLHLAMLREFSLEQEAEIGWLLDLCFEDAKRITTGSCDRKTTTCRAPTK